MSVSTDGFVSDNFEDRNEVFQEESADTTDTAIDSLNGCVILFTDHSLTPYHIIV